MVLNPRVAVNLHVMLIQFVESAELALRREKVSEGQSTKHAQFHCSKDQNADVLQSHFKTLPHPGETKATLVYGLVTT